LTVRDQFKEKNLEYIANFLAEEDMFVQGFDMGPIYKFCKEKKANEYKNRLNELANTRIIYHKKLVWNHHEFKDPQYQMKLKELIEEFYDNK
jgi:predicted metallo-beta-lactamase superfamily hydrolase